jgi:hypothetical protein
MTLQAGDAGLCYGRSCPFDPCPRLVGSRPRRMDTVENVTTRALEAEPQAPAGSPADRADRLGTALFPAIFALLATYAAYALAADRVSWRPSATLRLVLVALCIGQAAAGASLAWTAAMSRWSWRRYTVWAALFAPWALTLGTVIPHAPGATAARALLATAAGTAAALISTAWKATRLSRPT